jgi:hypothetical protein
MKNKPDFHHSIMAIDTFEYKYNENPFHRLNKD